MARHLFRRTAVRMRRLQEKMRRRMRKMRGNRRSSVFPPLEIPSDLGVADVLTIQPVG